MKALICNKPGEFVYNEIAKPSPGEYETLLKVKRIGVCGTDLHAFEGTQPFFNYPRILGHELALEVVDAKGFSQGDAVTIIPYFHCGECIACRNGKTNCCTKINVFGVHIDGGMREYITVPLSSLIDGNGLTYDQLALVEPLAIGAHAVKRAEIKKDEYVLVVGAGPIGLGVMEFAMIAGAKVIAIDMNEARLAFCKEKLNVPFIINAAKQNVNEQLRTITNNGMPSVVVDATGNLKAINASFQYISHGGKYILVGLQKENISFSHPEFHKREATLMGSRNATKGDFEYVIQCIKQGLISPATYITHRVKFEEVKDNFSQWLDPSSGVIKAIVEMN